MAHGPTRSPRRRIGAALMAMGLLTGTFSVLTPMAGASSHQFGPYEVDGVLDVHASIEHFPDEASGAGDDAFAGGVKEDDPCPGLSNTGTVVQSNNDLTDFWIGAETVDGATYLYLAFERADHQSVASANYLLSFELNQSETSCGVGSPFVQRTVGDLLIAFRGEQPNQIELSEWEWDEGAQEHKWSAPATISGSSIVRGALSADHLFGEAVINLHAAGIFSAEECTSFANAFAKTRSSWSGPQSQLKDFIAPGEGVSISNCGRLVVEKETTGDVDGDETFSFEVDCGQEDPLEFDLGDGEAWPADVDDAEHDDNLFFYGTTCTVTETDDLDDDDTWTTTYVVTMPGEEPTEPAAGTSAGDLVIEEGTIVVTFTNHRFVPPEPGTLKVTKAVAGDDDPDAPDDFGFEVVCGDDEDGVTFALENGESWPDDVTGDPDDTYESFDELTSCTVTETEELGDGWTTSYEVFVDDGEDADESDEGDSVIVEVGPDRAVHVVFTNTFTAPPGTLVVSKTVSDGVGNGSQVFQFAITCDGDVYDAFALGHGEAWPDDVQDAESNELDPGTECSVSETAVSGWTTTHSIDGGTAQPGTTTADFTIASGQETTVAFRNRRSGGTIVIIDDTTTTTVPPTTTTVAPTTTVPPTTTTEPEVAPVVVEPEPTTTTATVLGVVQERELPRTGGDIGALLLLAGIAMLLGGLALAFERPPAPERRRRL